MSRTVTHVEKRGPAFEQPERRAHVPIRVEVDSDAMALIADLQRAAKAGDAALALTVCQAIDRMTRDGEYIALARIDWGDDGEDSR